jgi:integrase
MFVKGTEGQDNEVFVTIAVPIWVRQGINAWMTGAEIEDGRLLRPVSKSGKILRDELGDWAIWSVVEQSSKQIGIEHFGAHDLRRTCAKLCRKNGHSSIQTTERYLGSEQDNEIAVNDNLGLKGQGERVYFAQARPEVSWNDSAKIRPGGRNAG